LHMVLKESLNSVYFLKKVFTIVIWNLTHQKKLT